MNSLKLYLDKIEIKFYFIREINKELNFLIKLCLNLIFYKEFIKK